MNLKKLYVARTINYQQLKELEKIEEELAEYNIKLLPQIKINGDPKTKSGFFNPKNLKLFWII